MRSLFCSAAIVLVLFQPAFAQTPRPLQERFAKHSVTIRGKATNREGQPVAGASVYVLSTNQIRQGGVDAVVTKTVTDATGAYVLRDVPLPILGPDGGPIKKYSEGEFQVFGTAAGYGFTWHVEQFVRLEQRPAASTTGPDQFFLGEDCVADLAFDLPATVQGVITNDRDQPLAGVKVQLGDMSRLAPARWVSLIFVFLFGTAGCGR